LFPKPLPVFTTEICQLAQETYAKSPTPLEARIIQV
jgi:hypothetical protein